MDSALGFFILVDAGDNDVHKIREELLKIDDIKLVHCLIGPSDLICYGKTKDLSSLKALIVEHIAGLMESTLNSIQRTETLISLSFHGANLEDSAFAVPQKQAAWVFADINMAGAIAIQDKLLKRFPEIKAVYSVLGSHDTLFYVEAEEMNRLMEIIDDGIRIMRGIGFGGKPRKALARTDTRLVLMDKLASVK